MTSLLLKTAHNASPPPSASLRAHHPPPRTENFSCRIQILWRDESQIMAGVGAKAKAREKSFSSSWEKYRRRGYRVKYQLLW